MSTDLTIFPLKRGPRALGEDSVLVVNRLDFDQDYRIFGQLIETGYEDKDVPENPTIIPLPLPPQLWVEIYGEEGIRRARGNPFGGQLVFVYAQQMKRLVIPENTSPWNKAIKAFIDALPDEIPIILYLH